MKDILFSCYSICILLFFVHICMHIYYLYTRIYIYAYTHVHKWFSDSTESIALGFMFLLIFFHWCWQMYRCVFVCGCIFINLVTLNNLFMFKTTVLHVSLWFVAFVRNFFSKTVIYVITWQKWLDGNSKERYECPPHHKNPFKRIRRRGRSPLYSSSFLFFNFI